MTQEMNFNRDYEVSVWTLQDSFITVLKWSGISHKGTIQEPKMTINTDGTQNFSFSIPMSLYLDGVWRENPIWYNTQNGTLITNMRKIKVIFNKGDKEDEEVFEFLITGINMTHQGDIPMCEITCDGGLAYHELGKQGYKISLSSDAFYEEDAAMFSDTTPDEQGHLDLEVVIDSTRRLHPTIDYWCQKMDLTYAAQDSDIKDPRKWYYRVQMDWSSYSNTPERRLSSKVYEEEYVASWDEDCNAERVETYTEKERLIDEENSNFYNLTQNLAKTFGVYCRYKYLYDDNYHITGKLIIFYNNFFNEREGTLQLSYPNTTTNVTRNIDSTDIVTKMYVDSIEDDSDYGILTIMNSDVNKTREDYLLNFDYLRDVKTITDDQYNAIAEYEKKIRKLNDLIVPLQQTLSSLAQQKTDVSAKKTVADNGITQDTERLSYFSDKIKALDNTDGIYDGVISRSSNNPESHVVAKGTITLDMLGVVQNSIHVYPQYPITENTQEIKSISKKVLDNGKTQLDNISTTGTINSLVYVVYNYDPAAYYREQIEVWQKRLEKDTDDRNSYDSQLNTIESNITNTTNDLQLLLNQKKNTIDEFALMMGPALREGHWTPEDYTNYGDRYTKTLQLPIYRQKNNQWQLKQTDTVNHLSALWDSVLFDDEQKNYYELGVNQEKIYYPHIKLTDDSQWIKIINALNSNNKVSLVYYDYAIVDAGSEESNETYEEQEYNKDYHWHIITIGSGAEIIFLKDTINHKIQPSIIILDADTMPDDELKYIKNNSQLAVVTTVENNNTVSTNINVLVELDKNTWYSNSYLNACPQVYPRLCIDTLDLMDNSNEFGIRYNGQNLKNYYDYSILIRDTSNLITLDATTLLLKGKKTNNDNIIDILKRDIEIKYVISNASTSIYLDSVSVLSENSHPKVSYTVSPSILNKNMIKRIYKYLNRIININDNELKLHDAYGYISALDLDLDQPWQDSITVQNYNNKFEDLFSTITAQTEEMQRREYSLNQVMQVVQTNGTLDEEIIQNTLASNGISYDFNNHKLIINETDGILGSSELGVVSYRNNGIFTAETKDENGEWVWKSAIVSTGINADNITTGQLDTSKIFIYSGDDVKFQWNEHGIYAYRSIIETAASNNWTQSQIDDAMVNRTNDVNPLQYVVFNSEGLHLINNSWTVKDDQNNDVPVGPIRQVEVSWDGFIMRNIDNEKIFYADSSTGNLTIRGAFQAGQAIIFDSYNTNEQIVGKSPPVSPFFVNNNGDMYIGPTKYYDIDDGLIYWNCQISHEGILTARGATIYGNIYADNGIFNGTITSYDGNIGGWIIDDDKLYHSFQVNDSNNLSPGSQGYVETLQYVGVGTGNYAFWAGSTVEDINNTTQAKFSVSKSGILTATGANITGEINATIGHVGGWIINNNMIYHGTLINDASGRQPGSNDYTVTYDNDFCGIGSSDYAFWAGGSSATINKSKFYITKAGKVTMSDAEIIGGFITIKDGNTDKFKVTNTGKVTANDLTLNGGSINISDNFIVNHSGKVTINSGSITIKNNNNDVVFKVADSGALTATSGTIGGWSIENQVLRSPENSATVEGHNGTIRLALRSTAGDSDAYKKAIRLYHSSVGDLFVVGYDGSTRIRDLKLDKKVLHNTNDTLYFIKSATSESGMVLVRVDDGSWTETPINFKNASSSGSHSNDWNDGWNACVDAIKSGLGTSSNFVCSVGSTVTLYEAPAVGAPATAAVQARVGQTMFQMYKQTNNN